MVNNYILGGGITGLIFAFYNKNYFIISKDIGGQFKNSFNLGVRLLEDNNYSRQFLKDLKIEIKPKLIKVGYCQNKTIKPIHSKSFIKAYFKKSRGTAYAGEKFVLNNNKNEMSVLNVDFDLIIKKLNDNLKDRIISDMVTGLNLKAKKIEGSVNDYLYDNIISSISLPLMLGFCGLKKQAKNYKAKTITYIKLKKGFIDLSDYDFVYFSGKQPFHRISRDKDFLIVEIKGYKSERALKKYFKSFYIESKTVKNIQIVSGKPLKEINSDIKLLGRYGTFDRSYKIEKVIEESIKFATNEE